MGMSGSASRRKGNRSEVQVANLLRQFGYTAVTSRSARGGYQSGEDIVSNFPCSIEVKNQARTDLAGWYRQAEEQSMGKTPIVVHKRVGKAQADDWWVTLTFGDLIRLLRERGDEPENVSQVS
jgi:hypothetical protein